MSNPIQRSFAGGEIGPALYARTDMVKYASGLRTCRNCIIMRHGGSVSRAGTRYVGEVYDSTKTGRLLPFIYDVAQTAVLVMGNLHLRIVRNDALVTGGKTITAISQAAQAVVTVTAHSFKNGDQVTITGVVGMTQVNNITFLISDAAANTFKIKTLAGVYVNSTGYTAYVSDGTATAIWGTVLPWTEAQLTTLQFTQKDNAVTIAHPSHAVTYITMLNGLINGSQALTAASGVGAVSEWGPSIARPENPTNNGAAGTATKWKITAIAADGEESLVSNSTGSSATPSSGSPITVSWDAVALPVAAVQYNVYKLTNGLYGFIGTAGTNAFIYTGITADYTFVPPTFYGPFQSTDNYPSVIASYQQRRVFAAPNNYLNKVWTTDIGHHNSIVTNFPLADDDSAIFSILGRKFQKIMHIVDAGQMLILTSAGEWGIQGNADGVLTPTEINPKQFSENGSGTLPPILIDGTVLYVQARGSIIRDTGFDFQIDGYRGNDLTIFAPHLVEGHTIVDWAYQKTPHSLVWAVRDDGVLLSLTYVREQQILAWHKHDLAGGTVENVCVIPEGTEDVLYLLVKRTIDGSVKRYIERMTNRFFDDVVDFVGMDCAFTVDGRNTGVTTMTLSGSGWTYTDTLTLTASASTFVAGDVDNEIHLTGADGTVIRFQINHYTSATVVTGKPHRTVPASMHAVATATWTKAILEVTGLDHLEGEAVSVFADGFVVASPNNEDYPILTVTDGAITLDKPYGVIHVGLPFLADLETLDIDTVQGETIVNKKKLVTEVTLQVEKSRGIWVGAKPPTDDDEDPLEGLTELKARSDEGYDEPVDLKTEVVEVKIQSSWSQNGRIFIRQVDPLPMSILAVTPTGLIPSGRG